MSCHRFPVGTEVLLTEADFPDRPQKAPFKITALLPSGRTEPWYLLRSGTNHCLAAEHQISRRPGTMGWRKKVFQPLAVAVPCHDVDEILGVTTISSSDRGYLH
jgi:hypothetical protein